MTDHLRPSTFGPSVELLRQCAKDLQVGISPRVVVCDTRWSHFETGDRPVFAQAISDWICVDAKRKAPDCIVASTGGGKSDRSCIAHFQQCPLQAQANLPAVGSEGQAADASALNAAARSIAPS